MNCIARRRPRTCCSSNPCSASRYAASTAARPFATASISRSLARAATASTSGSLAFSPAVVALRALSNPKFAIPRSRAISAASPLWISPPSPTAKVLVACIDPTTANGASWPKPWPASSIVPSDDAASTTTPTR